MLSRLAELIRGMERSGDAYSRAFQTARVRASYQRALELTRQEPQRRFLERRLRELES